MGVSRGADATRARGSSKHDDDDDDAAQLFL